MTPQEIAALVALADGIIPPDNARAGERLAERVGSGELHRQGVEAAQAAAREKYGRGVEALQPEEIHVLLGVLRERLPVFFKQLRMDVSAIYLGDPAVWPRIGFPGPSTASGGYPDFDRPQDLP